MTLFCHGKDAAKEKWDGAKTDLGEVTSLFGADDARHVEHFSSHLQSIISKYDHVYLDPVPDVSTQSSTLSSKRLLDFLSSDRKEHNSFLNTVGSSRVRSLAAEISTLRSIKSPAEQRIMKDTADISGRAHAKTMRFTQPGLSESSIAAHFEYMCALSGSERPAYVPVVASGANSLIIHYTANNHVARSGEMLLIDAGCEYRYEHVLYKLQPSLTQYSVVTRQISVRSIILASFTPLLIAMYS
jgi:intermediate cleaving peptidase 55